jgi:hypothetical protein
MSVPTDGDERSYAQGIAVRYWQQGLSIATIAKQDGVSSHTVAGVMKRWGIPRRTGRTGLLTHLPELPDRPPSRGH